MQNNPNNYPLFHDDGKGLGKKVLVDINDVNNIEFVLDSLLEILKEEAPKQAENYKPYNLYFQYGSLVNRDFIKLEYAPTIKELNEFEDEIEEAYTSEDAFFFKIAQEYPALHPKIKEWVDYANGLEKAVFCSDEHVAFTSAALSLALTDKQYIHDYRKFLETNDLDHGVYQFYHMLKLIEHWKGQEEMYPLLVAATCGLADQHIGEMVYIPHSVDVEDSTQVAAFFKQLLLTIHSDARGNKRSDYDLKNIFKYYTEKVFKQLKLDYNEDRLKLAIQHLNTKNPIELKDFLNPDFPIV